LARTQPAPWLSSQPRSAVDSYSRPTGYQISRRHHLHSRISSRLG
jgi:hypothetical protein